jgi:spore coat polysaccharide biosynthesis protein SpsF
VYRGKRVAAVVLARARSSRLENKMTMPFNGHETVVESVIDRIKQSRLIDEFVFATSDNPEDKIFTAITQRAHINLVRGDENDVVARMQKAIGSLDIRPDVIVRVCSDNPLLMPSLVDESISQLIDAKADVVTPFETNSYPFGLSLVVMTTDCLERIDVEADDTLYREHVENFCFDHPEIFTIGYQEAPSELAFPELCLTLDYATDYVRLERYAIALKNVAIDKQPAAVIDFLLQVRLCIVADEGMRKLFNSIIQDVTGKNPTFVNDLSGLKNGEYDLIISSLPMESHPNITAPLGVFWPGPETNTFRPILCRLDAVEPFIVHEGEAQIGESESKFLARELNNVLPYLLAGPPRALSERHKSGEKMKRSGSLHRPGPR